MRNIAHIINPVNVGETSDLFIAQPITFETMRRAKDFAGGSVEVALFSAQYKEDLSIVPDGFKPTPDLNRSVLDFGTFHENRKLPLLKDIIDRMYDATDAEYLIYTNVDIALMPHFYVAVNMFIESGIDAFVINRRTISNKHKRVNEIPFMYSDVGEAHPGHDCFVFRRDVYPRYKLGSVCIGISWIGRVLLLNLACRANNFKEFTDKHLSFHIGEDQLWNSSEYSDYTEHNKIELLKSFTALDREFGPFDCNSAITPYINDIKKGTNSKKRGGIMQTLLKKISGI